MENHWTYVYTSVFGLSNRSSLVFVERKTKMKIYLFLVEINTQMVSSL